MPLFAEAIRALEHEARRTRALIGELTDADALRLVWDDWSIKDVLGHIATSDRVLADALAGPAEVRSIQTLAERNEARRQERRPWSFARVVSELEEVRGIALGLLGGLTDAEWPRETRTISGRLWRLGEIAWQLSRHEREHREEIEALFGRRAPGGRVAFLNVSPGGVPKLPVFSAALSELGLSGDAHRNPRHGGPTAALCLYSLEVIERLRAEGHPIGPGAVGENVTVAGLDWSIVKPGDRFRIGQALVEITRYTTPCVNIQGAFVEGDFARILSTRSPGESRAYARVIEPGTISVGDPVLYQAAEPP